MKIKSFVSLLLIFVISLVSVIPSYAQFTDIEESIYKDDILDLYKLGIVQGNENDEFEPFTTVTRGEFCSILLKLSGVSAQGFTSGRVYFADVPQEHKYFDAIGYAASRGFVNGYPDGSFYPDMFISYDQVNKIIVDFLGYKYLADSHGGYPTGYRVAGNYLDLTKGIDLAFEMNINKDELCRYLNNALDVPLVEMVGVGTDGIFEINDEVTILTQYLKLKRVKGFVEANSFYSLSDNDANDNCLVINGVNYLTSDVSQNSFVGKHVNAIVKIDESKKTEEIFSIKESDDAVEIELTPENSPYYENYTVSYYTADGKSKSVRLSSDLKLIYNGEEKVFDKKYINNPFSGTIRFISKNANSVYDALIISDYTSMVVNRKNEHRSIVYDPSGIESFDFSKDITYNIKNSDGNIVSFADITEGSVITYFENSKFAEGFVTNYTVSGKLTELGSKDGKIIAYINGETYPIDESIKTRVESYGVGSQIKLYMDVFDCAIYAEKVSVSTDRIKYLFKLANSSDTALDSTLMAKFYDIDNGIEILEFANDVRVNGTTIKNAKAADINIAVPQMVQIKLDEENKVSSVTTSKTYEEFMSNPGEDGFCEVFSFKSRRFQVDSDSFENKILFTNSTKIMIVPSDMTSYTDKSFKTVTETSFVNDGMYDVAAYNSTVDYVIPEMIVCRMSANQSTSVDLSKGDKLFTISTMSKVINEDGEVLTKVTGFFGSKETYFYIDPEDTIVDKYDATLSVYDLEPGDIIFCNRNSDSYIKAFTQFYDKNTGYSQKIAVRSLNQAIVVMESVAKKIASPYFYFLDSAGDNPYDYYMFKSGDNVTVIEHDRGETLVSGGTLNDIDIGDKIIIHIRYTIVESIVVFKD